MGLPIAQSSPMSSEFFPFAISARADAGGAAEAVKPSTRQTR